MTNLDPGSGLELGTAMARASWDAALRSGAQASTAMAEISKLQSETLARLMDETLRRMQAGAGAPAGPAASGEWAKIYQEHLQQSAAAARSLWQSALATQNEMNELANRVLAASTRAIGESLLGIARSMEQGGERKTPEPPQTAEAGVRKREKAA